MSTQRSVLVAVLALLAVACGHGSNKPEGLSTVYHEDLGVGPPDAGAETAPETAPEQTPDAPQATAAFVAGPGGVPLPEDATQNTTMPTAGGKMSVFEIPRAKEPVVAELRTNLAADGWTIDSEEVSPGYGAVRMKISKAGAIVDCRVTGDDTKTGIIITLK